MSVLNTVGASSEHPLPVRRILGVDFFVGTAAGCVDRMLRGGLLVVPAAPALIDLPVNTAYREALCGADVVIPDSAFMVLIWRLMTGERIERISGLEYLREFLSRPEAKVPGAVFWVMAGEESSQRNLAWLGAQGIAVRPQDVYIAPRYGSHVEDPELARLLSESGCQHVVITIGGGKQEQLGYYLRRNLQSVPGIHCIGAAIAFLSGDQVHIPAWADYLGLGWLFRCLSRPGVYVPRYWAARKLAGLMFRFRDRMPIAAEPQ
jgi:exopolysaccharide biosynthesis WecB/TagA/CpsF family protein